MPQLFIIAGPNGAGKTTASYTILPELLNIYEFVNADEIARGLSPFRPEGAAIEAGRIMLTRIRTLIVQNQDFAFETTLATKSFLALIQEAKKTGYQINLVYFWLEELNYAVDRVKTRVAEGGHDIPKEVIIRRYYRGMHNFIYRYSPEADYWLLLENSNEKPIVIADGKKSFGENVHDNRKWKAFNNLAGNESARD